MLVLFVLPGVSFQFARERFRGPGSRQRDLAERVLLAVTASIVLDTAYIGVFGRALIDLVFSKEKRGWFPGPDPRPAATLALILLFLVPAASGWATSRWEARRRKARYSSTPPWQAAIGDRDPCFIRARTKSGHWVGGWFGNRSNIALHDSAELFLESAWQLTRNGQFEQRVDGSSGLYLRLDDLEYIEFIDPPDASEENSP